MKLTSKQKNLLEQSPHVVKTTDFNVVYMDEFKSQAVRLFDEGLTAPEIFEKFGLKFDFFNEYYFSSNLKRWRKVVSKEGDFSGVQRGRPRKPSDFSINDLSIEDLRALVFIQGEAIEALKKKKALAKKK